MNETAMFQIRQDPGNAGLIFFTFPTELSGTQTIRIQAEIVKTHDVGTFQSERLHTLLLDLLYIFIDP